MYIQITTSLPFSITLFVCYQIVFYYLAVKIHTTPLVDFQWFYWKSTQRQCDGEVQLTLSSSSVSLWCYNVQKFFLNQVSSSSHIEIKLNSYLGFLKFSYYETGLKLHNLPFLMKSYYNMLSLKRESIYNKIFPAWQYLWICHLLGWDTELSYRSK